MNIRPNFYWFSSPKSDQEPLDYVGESKEDVFQLGLPSPEFLPNTITNPDGEPIEDVNAVADSADYTPRRINYERHAQIVFPTMKEFFLKDRFFSVVVPPHKRIEQVTPSTPPQSDSSQEPIGQAPSLIPLHIDPSQIYSENAPSTAPSQFDGKQHIPYSSDIPSPGEKQTLEYILLRNASRMALRTIPDDVSMWQYWDVLEGSLTLIQTVVRDIAPRGLSKRSDVPVGPCLDDFLSQYVVEFDGKDSSLSFHEPRLSVRKGKSETVELERPKETLRELVRELSFDVEEYALKVRPIKKGRELEDSPPQYNVRGIERVKKYMNGLRGAILNGESVSSIIHTLVYNRPVSHFTAQQNTQIGEYLRDIISSEVEQIEKEDQLLSERVRRSSESDNLLPSIIYDIVTPKPRDYRNRHTEVQKTPFQEYLSELLPSMEKQNRESNESHYRRRFESINIEDIRELIKIKDEEVMQGHMYKVAYLAELTSGFQEYFPSVSNNLPDLSELQSRLFRSYVKRVSAFDPDADAPESKYIREHKNRNGHVNDPRERSFIPQDSIAINPPIKVDIIPAQNRPLVMRDSLFSDVYLLKR